MAKPRNEQEREGDTRNSSRRRRTSSVADYASCSSEKLLCAITNVARHGGALRFGYTSDGGAYAIGVYGDGDAYTEYIKPSESLDDYLDELSQAWE
jgi:hypothetical protein